MTREKLIEMAANKYCQEHISGMTQIRSTTQAAFEAGAKWAEEFPDWDLIIKVWNLATRTTIAQVNKEMAEFNSEKEIIEYIIKAL